MAEKGSISSPLWALFQLLTKLTEKSFMLSTMKPLLHALMLLDQLAVFFYLVTLSNWCCLLKLYCVFKPHGRVTCEYAGSFISSLLPVNIKQDQPLLPHHTAIVNTDTLSHACPIFTATPWPSGRDSPRTDCAHICFNEPSRHFRGVMLLKVWSPVGWVITKDLHESGSSQWTHRHSLRGSAIEYL